MTLFLLGAAFATVCLVPIFSWSATREHIETLRLFDKHIQWMREQEQLRNGVRRKDGDDWWKEN